jgi:hypothetical protein
MMTSKTGFLYTVPFYPLLLGIYTVLYLWLVNIFQVPDVVVIRPLLFSMAISVGVCGVTWLFLRRTRNVRKAAAVAGLFLALFFVYGRVFDLISKAQVFGILIGRHRYLMLVWAALFIGISILIVRSRSQLYTLTWMANLAISFLLLLTVAQLAYAAVGSSPLLLETPTPSIAPLANKTAPSLPKVNASSPDVYYILLDGYDREDLLRQDIGVSNHAFITELEQMGFVVPNCTQSNYNSTVFSVAGTFNMNYLDALGFSYEDLSKAAYGLEFSTPELEASIHANPVMQQFKTMGYKIITFHEAYPFINFPNSDIVFDLAKDAQARVESSKFQYLFWKTTAIDFLIEETASGSFSDPFDKAPVWLQQAISDNFSLYQKYQQDLYQLDQLDHITQVPGKKFVYAHLMITHPDFAFTASGEYRDNTSVTKAAYGDQVTYADQRILAIVKNILASSQTPPIIILQGDHGYGLTERGVEQFKILNAYYLPKESSAIYPSITPVNTFRLILSRYYGQNYPLLPDQSIWIQSAFPDGYQMEPGTCEP